LKSEDKKNLTEGQKIAIKNMFFIAQKYK